MMAEKGGTKKEKFILRYKKYYIISFIIIIIVFYISYSLVEEIFSPNYKNMLQVSTRLRDSDGDGIFDEYRSEESLNRIIIRDKLSEIEKESLFFDIKTFLNFESTIEYRDVLPQYDISFLGVIKDKNLTGEDIVIIVYLDDLFKENDNSKAMIEINTFNIFLFEDFQKYNQAHKNEVNVNIAILLSLLGISIPTIISYRQELPLKNFEFKDKKIFSFSFGVLFSAIGYSIIILPYIITIGLFSEGFKESIIEGVGLVSGFREVFHHHWIYGVIIAFIVPLIIFLIVSIITHSIIDKKTRDKQ